MLLTLVFWGDLSLLDRLQVVRGYNLCECLLVNRGARNFIVA